MKQHCSNNIHTRFNISEGKLLKNKTLKPISVRHIVRET